MKVLLYAAVVAVLLIVGLLGYGLSLDSHWRVERSAVIDAPQGPVFAYVSILRNWPEWTVWNPQKYPSMKYSYGGSEWGVGATQQWDDGAMQGMLRVTDYRPGEFMEYELVMEQGKFRMRGSLSIEPAGAGSRLTWACWGDSGGNPVNKLMMRFYRPMIARDFNGGLANLQQRLRADRSIQPGAEHGGQDSQE